jgi:hypothetical protein
MSRFPNRRWLVIPATEVENVDFNQVLESSADSLRYSVDGSQTFVKYEVRVVEETYTETHTDAETNEEVTTTIEAGTYGRPSIYSESFTEYDHAGILELLATKAWTAPMEDIA